MKKKLFTLFARYSLCVLLGGVIGAVYSANYIIENSISIIQKEYQSQKEYNDIEYPIEVINIQRKIDMQLGLYRGMDKFIGMLSLLMVSFFVIAYINDKGK